MLAFIVKASYTLEKAPSNVKVNLIYYGHNILQPIFDEGISAFMWKRDQ